MLPVHLVGTDLDDIWHRALRLCLMHGHRYKVDKGSYEGQDRYEFDFFTCRVKKPCGPFPSYAGIIPIMPEGSGLLAPTSLEYVRDVYLPEFLYMEFQTSFQQILLFLRIFLYYLKLP